jgi:hypothetical protein
MIRRDDRGDWLIIDQIEHARLAAELARHWGARPPTMLPVEDARRVAQETPAESSLCIWLAVAVHDDGWDEWDRSPRIHPQTGRPREFREMRMEDSAAIWTKSIENAASIPLAAYGISRHFCFLAQQSRDSGHADPDDRQAAERFLRDQARVQARLADDAHASGRGREFDQCHELAYRAVQFFDRLSLWLCCSDPTEPQSFISPSGETVTLHPGPSPQTPQSAQQEHGPGRQAARPITIEPYPLCVERMWIKAPARRIPARPYADDSDLRTALSRATPEQLIWLVGRPKSN